MSESGDDDDPRMRALRAVWLSLPDEEPPTRGIAELMAHARAKAETLQEPSWWQRISHVLRRPQVLALASVTILIGGAVVITRHKSELDATPTVKQEMATSEKANDGTPRGAANGVAMGSAAFEAKDSTGLSGESPNTPASPPVPQKTPIVASPAPTIDPPREHASPIVRSGHAHHSAAPVKEPAAESPVVADERGRGELAISAFPDSTDKAGVVKPKSVAPAAPQPELAPMPKAEADDDAPANTRGPQLKLVGQLYQQCKQAATRGDCEAARLIAQRIAKQDASYYRDHVAKDAQITKCLSTAVE